MTSNRTLRAIQWAHRVSLRSSRREFDRAAHDCERAQLTKLWLLVSRNAQTAYGRAMHFSEIQSVRAWQSRVPVASYEEHEPWVQRAAAGEPNMLTVEPVRVFEETSGSTSAAKLVPYTAGMLAEFGAATGPWLHDLYSGMPELRGTRSYWSVSPVTRQRRMTGGGIPIGFDDDSEYFGPLARAAIRRTLAVPPEVARIADVDDWRRATLVHLAGADDLGLVSVWHPSFFTLLLDALRSQLPDILDALPAERARTIRARLEHLPLARALWPRMALVSCWADGPAAASAAALQRELPQARMQAKGLLATEGVVSFPLHMGRNGASYCVAAINSHVLEFDDLDAPGRRIVFAHQLRIGGQYVPILTTAGGLYRYRMGDAVRCVGLYFKAPLLEFVGRIDQVSDLRGEKLNAVQVDSALAAAERDSGAAPAFALLAPADGHPPGYRLYVERVNGNADALRAALERALHANPGYAYARTLGQLAPLEVVPVVNGAARYQEARVAHGDRAGNIKPTHLDASQDWARVFDVARASIGART